MLPGVGYGEMILIGIVAIVLFGGRLPEVARSLGSSYQQFRKGLNEITSSIQTDLEIDDSDRHSQRSTAGRLPDYQDHRDDYEAPTAPKFVPPPSDEESGSTA